MRRTATIASIVSSVLAACGGTTADDSAARDGGSISDGGSPTGDASLLQGTPVPCEPKGLAALTASPPTDYLEQRREGFAVDGGPPDVKVDERSGEACRTAKDRPACLTALAQLSSPFKGGCGVPDPCEHRYIAYTRGDEVGVVPEGDAAALAFFAPIETITEAAALSLSSLCSGGRYEETSSGFTISYEEDECDGSRRFKKFSIGRDGKRTTLDDREISPAKWACTSPVARRAAGARYDMDPVVGCGSWLAASAHLEAASVLSFARLARELAAYGAPASLVRRVRRAARDEARHARAMSALARRYGGAPRRVRPLSTAVRPLLDVALENAAEGGVRETFGAVVAAFQARTAQDHAVRTSLRAIASDEAQHSVLAADVATWISAQLTPAERARVKAACAATAAELAREIAREEPRARREALGLPSASQARALLAATSARLFLH